MGSYKLSVIIPVYNVEEYLEQCLKSVLKQTLKGIEIIIVNDGSTDSSGIIARKYSEKYENISVINQSNKGLAEARNTGINNANGEYITFLDSDDYIVEDMYERMYNKAIQNDCNLIISDIDLVWENGENKAFNGLKLDENKIYTSDEQYKLLLTRKLNCQVVNKIYKTSIWKNANIRFESNRYYEDIIPSFIIAKEFKECMFINDALYKYRMRQGSITANTSEKKIYDLFYAINKAKFIARKNIVNIKLFDELFMSFDVNYGTYISSLAIEKYKIDKKTEIIREILKSFFNYSSLKVIFSKDIFLKSKIKYVLYKLKFYKLIRGEAWRKKSY